MSILAHTRAQDLTLLEGEELIYDYWDLNKAQIDNISAIAQDGGYVVVGSNSTLVRTFKIDPKNPLLVVHIRVEHTGHGDAGDYACWSLDPMECKYEYLENGTYNHIAVIDLSEYAPSDHFTFSAHAQICQYNVHPSAVYFAFGSLGKNAIQKYYCQDGDLMRFEVPKGCSAYKWYEKNSPDKVLSSSFILQVLPQQGKVYCCDVVFPTSIVCGANIIKYEISDDATACAPFLSQEEDHIFQSYQWRGRTLTKEGVYYDSLLNQCNCDSVYQLTLYGPYDSIFVDSICPEETYHWRGKTYEHEGHYTDTILVSQGRDSIYHLILSIRQPYISHETLYLCPKRTLTWHDKVYSQVGQDVDILESKYGCDSICYMDILEGHHSANSKTYTICKGTSVKINDVVYSKAGVYIDTIPNSCGCDSVITLIIVEKDCLMPGGDWGDHPLNPDADCNDPTYSTIDTTIIYDSLKIHPFQWFGQTYSTIGVYHDTIPNTQGCDSIGTLILRTIYRDSITACIDDSVGILTPWGDVPMVCDTIQGCRVQTMDYECLATLFLRVIREDCCPPVPPETITYANISKDEAPYLWRTKNYSLDGEYRDTVQTAAGCDSILILRLHIREACELPTVTLPYRTR